MKIMKKVLKIAGILFGAAVVLAGIYVLYVVITYNRIPDRIALDVSGEGAEETVKTDRTYTVVTQNCGFGAYSPDYTFFMDGGKESRGRSKEEVIANIDMAADQVKSLDPDFVLFQEVDTGSTRSFQVDQREQLTKLFPGYAWDFAVNFHSAYLMYPLTEPHGASNSGILTLSRDRISSGLRRSLEISNSFSKFLDLDRCYSVSRLPTEDGKELVLYNVHTSAYGGSDQIRTSQMTQLTQDMLEEYQKGNYCVCGGDFNHDFTGDSASVLNDSEVGEFGWVQPFPADLLPEGISRCIDYDDAQLLPSCRNDDVPYGPDCQVFVVDGFLVSDNVSVAEVHNIDAGFAYSDHNPVMLKFKLGK